MTLALVPMPSSRMHFNFSGASLRRFSPLTSRSFVNGKVRIVASKLSDFSPFGAAKVRTILPPFRSSRERVATAHVGLVLERRGQGLDQRRRFSVRVRGK